MKSKKIILYTFILAILVPIIINILISLISWGSGSNDGWLGFWGGYLGALISILGIYFQVAKSIENSENNRKAAKKNNDKNIHLLQEQANLDKEKIKNQQKQLDEQKIKDKVHKLQSVRPFIKVSFPDEKVVITFKGEIKDIWFKYGDIYYDDCSELARSDTYELIHKQLGSLCISPLSVCTGKKDHDYRFILKVKTIHNEEVFIYHTPGNPDLYCYEINPHIYNRQDNLVGSDGYVGITSSYNKNIPIFENVVQSTWLTAVKELDEKYRNNVFKEE